MKKSTSAILEVGSAETCPNIAYVTGFTAVDPALLVAGGGRKILVVSSMELGRARGAAGRRATVCSPRDLRLGGPARRRMSAWAGAALRRLGARRAVVSPWFPIGIARALEKAGFRLSVSRDALFPSRQVKTPDELDKMRETQAAAVCAMREAVRLIAASRADAKGSLRRGGRILTAETVRLAIERELLSHACMATQTIVACGAQAADPHESGHGGLRANEPIVIDIFPKHKEHGYWGDLTRTVVKGTASEGLRAMHRAVQAAQNAALRAVRAGIRAGRVHEAASGELARRGFETKEQGGRFVGFTHNTGHGVGLEIHEAPSIGPFPTRLRAGNVVTIEPGLYYPEHGGVRIEDTVVVTKSGWEYLAPCRQVFEV